MWLVEPVRRVVEVQCTCVCIYIHVPLAHTPDSTCTCTCNSINIHVASLTIKPEKFQKSSLAFLKVKIACLYKFLVLGCQSLSTHLFLQGMTLEKKEARAEKEEAEKYQKFQQELVSFVHVHVHVNVRTETCELC